MKKQIWQSSTILALMALFTFSAAFYWWWSQEKETFPDLPAGSYLGAMQGVFAEGPVKFYVEQPPNKDQLLVIVFKKSWDAQQVTTSMRSAGHQGSAEWGLPVILRSNGQTLRLFGYQKEPGIFAGKVVLSAAQNAEGSWELLAIQKDYRQQENIENENLIRRARLRAEIIRMRATIRQLASTIDESKQEIEQLNSFINNKEAAQASADAKYAEAQKEYNILSEVLNSKILKIKQAQEQLALALRVSPVGKLVALARESLEREARWAESMLRTANESANQGLDEAVARALEVEELKRQISEIQNSIFKSKYIDSSIE